MKRRYTLEQYRADVAKIYAPKSEPPGVNEALAEALAEGAEVSTVEETPPETAVNSEPPPRAGLVPRWSGLRQRVRHTP